jgi:adenylate cyclase
VRDKLEITFDDIGEKQLKNIARPVRVYRFNNAAATARPALPLPDKPSIAVLPFANMSGDPAQEYFSDGITENIITELSRFRDLFVIASNSSFAYKGKAIRVQDVARELGVRFILEGSVQRSNERVRVTAQLIDGSSGLHLWAERFDRKITDIFAVQDEVTETIVGTLAAGYGGRLRKAWQRNAERTKSQNFQAFDYLLRGFELFSFTKEGVARSRELFHRAIELDPNYAKALAKIAWAHLLDATYGWSEDYDASLAKGRDFAMKAIESDDDEAWAHWALAAYYVYTMRHELGLAEFSKGHRP